MIFSAPRRRIGFNIIVAGCAVFIVEAAIQTVVGHGQVVHGGHQRGGAIRQLQTFHRQLMQQNIFQFDAGEVFGAVTAKVREANLRNIVVAAEQAQAQFNLFAGGTVTLLKVPFPFFTQR